MKKTDQIKSVILGHSYLIQCTVQLLWCY